jgi:hypothetical protein
MSAMLLRVSRHHVASIGFSTDWSTGCTADRFTLGEVEESETRAEEEGEDFGTRAYSFSIALDAEAVCASSASIDSSSCCCWLFVVASVPPPIASRTTSSTPATFSTTVRTNESKSSNDARRNFHPSRLGHGCVLVVLLAGTLVAVAVMEETL